MDIKSSLKAAREAIRNKEYNTSLALSKKILKEDKNNYMALVFFGLSIQEVGTGNEAPKAFKKATEISPTNSLAWNGLISYYEKIDSAEAKQELIKLYCKVIFLEESEKKIVGHCEKLAKLSEYGDVIEIVKNIYNCTKIKVVENTYLFIDILVNLFIEIKDVPSELDAIYEECMSVLLEKQIANSEYYTACLNWLYKLKKLENVLCYAVKMYDLFPTETIFLIWVCKIFNELFVEVPTVAEKYFEKVSDYHLKLLENEPENAIGLFTKSIVLLKEEDVLKARDILNEVVYLRPGLLHAWILLTDINAKLYICEEAKDAYLMASRLLQSINNRNLKAKEVLDFLWLKILTMSSEEKDLTEALEIYNTMVDIEKKDKHIEFIIRAYINLEKFEEAKSLILHMQENNEKEKKCTLLLALLLHKQKKYQEALNLLEANSTDDVFWWIEIGLLYWDMGEYKKCLIPFLKAAKSNSNIFLSFLHLGHYYQRVEDFDKARRCYEKALKINTKSPHIGTELCKVYRKLKNWDAIQNLLRSITSGIINTKNSWAWLQLGLSYLEQEDYSNAIDQLRFVVRIQPENVHCWEALADAYLIRGSYTSALKCYEKSLELANNKLYPLLQIANIKKILGHYAEAVIDFEEVLSMSGQYVPALKGLAETCMYQAKECYRDQRLGTARDQAQLALEKLVLAIQQRSELSCLWKLLADSSFFVARLPEKYCCMLIPKSFLECKEIEGNSIAEKEDLYNLAIRSYCKAISLIEDNFLLWHDLGTCYFYYAVNAEDKENGQKFFTYAMAAAQHCTSKNHSNSQSWNLLGTIAMRKNPPNYALAQHAFIKAVTVNQNSAIAWTNLGVLYLLMNNIKLANKAFAEGQRSDPNYVNSWIGQALIAEKLNHEEAMDLFRHSTQLGQHQQGSLGYAHWVCLTLLDSPVGAHIYSIHNMHAIPVACDGLTWYTEKNLYDPCAWNMLGILRERMGLKESTFKAYKNAYRLSDRKHHDLARINYGRILSKLERYSEAIDIFQEVEEATFKSGSGLALALFHNKQYEESYSAYEQALHWLTEEQSLQSDLLIALAAMAYMFQGMDAAKTLLFQSIQLKPPSPWGFFATLSLALLHKDMKLAKLLSSELEIFKDEKDCSKHYALLICYANFLQGKGDRAVKEVSRLIHRYPDNPSLWLTLSVSLLREFNSKYSLVAAKSAQAAMIFGQTNMDVTKVLCLISLASSLAGNNKLALVSAQKAVHCYPEVAECWAVLISALKNKKDNAQQDKLVSRMSVHAKNLNPNIDLYKWLTNQTKT